jgi:hypothetical protein
MISIGNEQEQHHNATDSQYRTSSLYKVGFIK